MGKLVELAEAVERELAAQGPDVRLGTSTFEGRGFVLRVENIDVTAHHRLRTMGLLAAHWTKGAYEAPGSSFRSQLGRFSLDSADRPA